MHIIHYASDSYLTGDAIAEAVIEYAMALAKNDNSATVPIPFRRPDGTDGELELLIGPASQIVLEAVEDAGVELRDEALVARMRLTTQRLLGQDHTAVDAEEQDGVQNPIPEDL